jgi:hypothetical protein
MPDRKRAARHARKARLPRAARIVLTGAVVGLAALGIGALTNRAVPSTPGVTGVSPGPAIAARATATAGSTASQGVSASASGTATPGTDAVTPSRPVLVTDATYMRPVPDMGVLLPVSVAGYSAGVVETSTTSAILSLQPTEEGPMGRASLVVLTALDKGSAAGAAEYVARLDRAYPKDLATVRVGSANSRFGTDGAHLAAVTFARGRFAFEVVVTVPRDAPSHLKDVALQAAESFSAAQ